MTRSIGPVPLGPVIIGPVEAGAVAIRAAAGLLGAGCVVWAAAPLVHKGWANLALVLAIAGVAAGALRLVLAGVPVPEDAFLLPAPVRAWLRFLETLRRVPWEEGAVIALVWLEVMHRSRPWHTAFLGAALIAYLLATHLAESDASPGGAPAAGAGAGRGRGPARARRGRRDAARDRTGRGLGAAAAGRGRRADRRRRPRAALCGPAQAAGLATRGAGGGVVDIYKGVR